MSQYSIGVAFNKMMVGNITPSNIVSCNKIYMWGDILDKNVSYNKIV